MRGERKRERGNSIGRDVNGEVEKAFVRTDVGRWTMTMTMRTMEAVLYVWKPSLVRLRLEENGVRERKSL